MLRNHTDKDKAFAIVVAWDEYKGNCLFVGRTINLSNLYHHACHLYMNITIIIKHSITSFATCYDFLSLSLNSSLFSLIYISSYAVLSQLQTSIHALIIAIANTFIQNYESKPYIPAQIPTASNTAIYKSNRKIYII